MEETGHLSIVEEQQALCRKHGTEFVPSPGESKLGFALFTRGADAY